MAITVTIIMSIKAINKEKSLKFSLGYFNVEKYLRG